MLCPTQAAQCPLNAKIEKKTSACHPNTRPSTTALAITSFSPLAIASNSLFPSSDKHGFRDPTKSEFDDSFTDTDRVSPHVRAESTLENPRSRCPCLEDTKARCVAPTLGRIHKVALGSSSLDGCCLPKLRTGRSSCERTWAENC
jgi:hypothetical protein